MFPSSYLEMSNYLTSVVSFDMYQADPAFGYLPRLLHQFGSLSLIPAWFPDPLFNSSILISQILIGDELDLLYIADILWNHICNVNRTSLFE